jgi:hypothetical protein
MHHHHGGNARARLGWRFEHIPDECGFAVEAAELDPLRRREIAGRLRQERSWRRRQRGDRDQCGCGETIPVDHEMSALGAFRT